MRCPLLLAALACACGGSQTTGAEDDPTAVITRIDLGPSHRGLSGLATDEDGRLWTVSERGLRLSSFAADGSDQASVALAGLPNGIDLESIASLGGQRFAVGTEGRTDGRASDDILIVDASGKTAAIVDRITLEYQRLGISARDNQGIEGLCATGDVLLASFETVIEDQDRRLARLARINVRDKSWDALSLELTSETGKIAALDCRQSGARIEVLAVERHFEVARVLRFSIGPGDDNVITPTIAADLTKYRRETDNFEGVVWGPNKTALLILDNDFGQTMGPTELHRTALQ